MGSAFIYSLSTDIEIEKTMTMSNCFRLFYAFNILYTIMCTVQTHIHRDAYKQIAVKLKAHSYMRTKQKKTRSWALASHQQSTDVYAVWTINALLCCIHLIVLSSFKIAIIGRTTFIHSWCKWSPKLAV